MQLGNAHRLCFSTRQAFSPLSCLCQDCFCRHEILMFNWRPTTLQVSSGLSAWTAHLLVLKLVLWLLGVPSAVPFLEALCYTGYPLVSVCINTVVVTLLGVYITLYHPYPLMHQHRVNHLPGYMIHTCCCLVHHTGALTYWSFGIIAYLLCSAGALTSAFCVSICASHSMCACNRWLVILRGLDLWVAVYGHIHREDNEKSAV